MYEPDMPQFEKAHRDLPPDELRELLVDIRKPVPRNVDIHLRIALINK
jgi:hypothetical protein